MKVSVVIPVKNEEENLPRLLKSLREQDFPKKEFEVIVVDNNSTDKTVLVAKKFGARVVFEPRQGIPYARDTGGRSAKGEIIIGTDADCKLPKDHLKNIYNEFTKNPDLFGLGGSVFMPDASRFINFFVKTLSLYGHFSSKILNYATICWAPNFSIRRKAFEMCGGYDLERPLLRLGLNSHVTDEYSMSDRLMNVGGSVKFNKDIQIQTSSRRFKDRLLYWFLVEHMVGLVLNEKLYSAFGVIIPINGYERVSPKYFYRLAKATAFSSLFMALTVSGIYALQANNQTAINKEILAAQINYKKYEDLLMLKLTEPVKILNLKSILPQNKEITNPIDAFISS